MYGGIDEPYGSNSMKVDKEESESLKTDRCSSGSVFSFIINLGDQLIRTVDFTL